MKMPFKNHIKIFIWVLILVGSCFATLVWTGNKLGIQAVYTMDRYGIIEDRVAWNKTLKKYNYGEKIDTAEKASEVIRGANKHGQVLDITAEKAQKVTKTMEDLNLPSSTKYRGLTIINVPAAFTSQKENFPKQYAEKLAELINGTEGNIVLNLSNNVGGFFEPMVLGANALIPDGVVLSEVDNQKKSYPLTLKEGKLAGGRSNNRHPVSELSSAKDFKKKLDIKVAVVTNKNTASAGEYSVLVLKNNPKVKIFGGETGGYTSSNRIETLSSGEEAWKIIFTDVYLKSEKPIHGRRIFNNQKIKPDVAAPVTSIDEYKQNIVTPKENAELFEKIQAWFAEKES